mmetsp:Transcript_145027/g.205247  ORF Transcript_145027/g.205247 Transcript_145027/m.205247 type:complete len:347 (+) Transcript_145027:98-1138(+)
MVLVVAVTGGSGFIGSWIVSTLLDKGHTVRATVRDTSNKEKTAHLTKLAEGKPGKLELWQADLFEDGAFDECFKGANVVVHSAAVVSNARAVKDPIKDIVDPSVKGTQNVIDSIVKSGTVTRVVHTSSIAAIQTYDKDPGYIFTERDWNDWSSEANGDYYGIAKVKAEENMRAAGEEHGFQVVAINPGVVFGPCLTKAHTKASPVFVRQFLYGNTQPDAKFTWVDVREVAEAHAFCVDGDGVAGRRFILCGDHDTHFAQISTLAEQCQKAVPDIKLEGPVHSGLLYNLAWYLRMNAFEKAVIETPIQLSNEASKQVLGIKYRPAAETLKDTIDSMVSTGFVKARKL